MAKPILDDNLWRLIAPLLPAPKKRRFRFPGRKPIPNRAALTGILFVLKTGVPWEDLPKEMACGSGMTCWRRLRAWQKAGVQYIGVAWYRRTIDLPAKPKHVAVEMRFKGVDECAWVWVNGVYVGDHDLGPTGWDKEFTLDVTKELKWGAKNQITVRAMNTAHAGGIWRPVVIEVLQ